MNAPLLRLAELVPEKEPRHSAHAEQCVIGSLLLDPGVWPEVAAMLRPESFYLHEHRLIFSSIAMLIADGEPVDVGTVVGRLGANADVAGGARYLNELFGSVTSAANIGHHAKVVRAHAAERAALAELDFASSAIRDGRPIAEVAFVVSTKLASIGVTDQAGLEFVCASDLPEGEHVFADELVEGVLCESTMAVIYGDSNSGKTFAAVDLAAAVARGSAWLGRRCAPGLVIYLASEAPGSVELRLRAYQQRHGVRVRNLVIVKSPINLFDGRADVDAVLRLVAKVEAAADAKAVLIIGDTLARIAAGANENAAEYMSCVISNADAIRDATGAAFLWIAHCGKDAAKGMRGWSGMRAFIDTELEVMADEATGLRCLEITKQRDLGTKGERLGFRLESMVMGANQWGTPRSTCIVVPGTAPTKKATGKRPSEIEGAIVEFMSQHGTGCVRGSLVKHFEGRYARPSVYREVNKMIDTGLLISTGQIVALPGKPGPSA